MPTPDATEPAPPAAAPISVLIVEDQPLLLGTLRASLDAAEGITVVAGAGSAEQARAVAAHYDVLLTDISLPGDDGVRLARTCKAERPELGVLLLSAHSFPSVLAHLDGFAGGWGYLLKDSVRDVAEVARAVRVVADGGVMIDDELRRSARRGAGTVLEKLSPGQWRLLQAIGGGFSNQAIAQELHLTTKSVENAVGRLYQQLGIDATDRTRNARVEATRLLLRHGLDVA
jgi:DNA-binding NarL/FixJ family response regulator